MTLTDDERAVAHVDRMAKLREMEKDFAHALAEAKKYHPDYPWSDEPTMSEVVWALGQSYTGVCAANDDLHKVVEKVACSACRGSGYENRDAFGVPKCDSPLCTCGGNRHNNRQDDEDDYLWYCGKTGILFIPKKCRKCKGKGTKQ